MDLRALKERILAYELFGFPPNGMPIWRVRQACEGTQIFGATGSGKTSGSGRWIALSLLRARIPQDNPENSPVRFGGLVLTAKPDETALWIRNQLAATAGEKNNCGYCAQADRLSDVVVLGTNFEAYEQWGFPQGGYRFNFLKYEEEELRRVSRAALTQNVVSLFMAALSTGGDRAGRSDPYWNDALRQLLTNAIDLVSLGEDGGLSLTAIADVIRTAPQSVSEAASRGWREQSYCGRLIRRAIERLQTQPDPERTRDLRETVAYWTLDFAALAERTRSVIVSSFTSKITGLLRSPLRALFAEGETSPEVRPEATLAGKIIVLDLPVKDFGETGRFAQVLYKTLWQRAVERRRFEPPTLCPVFLWADESQYFVTAEDMLFQQTARSSLAATVYLTQNLPNYYAMLGATGESVATDSLLGNFQTKIFHANSEPVTNGWAERLFGSDIDYLLGLSFEGDRTPQQPDNRAFDSHRTPTQSLQPSDRPIVSARRFVTLKKGGPPHYQTEAIVFLDGQPFTAVFDQEPRVIGHADDRHTATKPFPWPY